MNSGISRFFNWIIVVLGVLEIVSPFMMGISAFPAFMNGFVVGVALIILGVSAAIVSSAGAARTLDIIIAILGAWLVALPLALGYANLSGSLLNSPILPGIIVLILAVLAVIRNNRQVARVEQVVPVYGRGSSPAAEVQTRDATRDIESDQPAVTTAATEAAQPGDYQGSDTTTRGGETAQDENTAQQENQRSDQDILDDIVRRLGQEKHLDKSNIRVSVKNGDVVLSGNVPTVVEQHLAGEVAGKVDGVRDVHNDLHVGQGAEAQLS